MNKPYRLMVAATPVLALALGACAGTGIGRVALPNTGSYQQLRTAPGPDGNAVAVLSDLRKTDSEFDKLRESGQLTKREKRKLDRAQARVRLLARSYREDSVVTDAERQEMGIYSRAVQDLAAPDTSKTPKP